MSENWTLKSAFAYFDGAVGRNPRWSWSARSAERGTVVLTLWEDEISDDGDTLRVDCYGHPRLHEWSGRLGNKERIENLAHARDRCGGKFRVVIVEAEDVTAQPRKIAKRYPHPTLVMKLSALNEATGEFRAESIHR